MRLRAGRPAPNDDPARSLEIESEDNAFDVDEGELELKIPTGLFNTLQDAVGRGGRQTATLRKAFEQAHHARWHHVVVNEDSGRELYDLLADRGHHQGGMSQAASRLEIQMEEAFGFSRGQSPEGAQAREGSEERELAGAKGGEVRSLKRPTVRRSGK